MPANYQLIDKGAIELPRGSNNDPDDEREFNCPKIRDDHFPVLYCRVDPHGGGMKVEMQINNQGVINQQVTDGSSRTISGVIPKDLMTENGNKLKMIVSGGAAGSNKVIRISEIVVLYQEKP